MIVCFRAAQKLNLSSSPHRRKRYSSEESECNGFCTALQKFSPPVPPALLRRIGVKEVTGVGKVSQVSFSNKQLGSVSLSIQTSFSPLLPSHENNITDDR